jgi:hypothetical protein
MKPQIRPPAPKLGNLGPGEVRTLPFGALPAGYMPMLHNLPGGQRTARVVQQDAGSITIQNVGQLHQPFGVFFVNQTDVNRLQGIKGLVESIIKLKGK